MICPKFREEIVQKHRKDGYWIETFKLDPCDQAPGLIGYGLDQGRVEFLDNPANNVAHQQNDSDWDIVLDTSLDSLRRDSHSDETGWPAIQIRRFDSPVAITVVDVDGDGLDDIIICYNYGKDFIDCNPNGGDIAWLKNPGREKLGQDPWILHYIGRWPAMHRLKAGYFTQRTFLELIALPIVHGPNDLRTPIPPRSVISDTFFTIIHDACKKKFIPSRGGGLESLILASREGLNWLYFEEGRWQRELINAGIPKKPGQKPQERDFWGSESVDVGRFEDDPFAYIAALEAFHGTTVSAYTKHKTGLQTLEWRRHVLDVFGTPTQQRKQGDGPGHFVITADFDNDGNDEFLVALWGPSPDEPGPILNSECQGVWYYKPVDLAHGIFAKWKVATESAGRIAVGDFHGDGKISFATISYSVSNYYKAPHPRITVHYNEFADACGLTGRTQFKTAYWDDQALVCIPKPTYKTHNEILPLLELASFRIELEILPPSMRKEPFHSADAIKVLFGAVQVADEEHPRAALSVPRYSSAPAKIACRPYESLARGAVLLRLIKLLPDGTTWPEVEKIPVKPLLKVSPPNSPQPEFQFHRVTKEKNFWNLKGFEIRFINQTPLTRIQFWAAGPKVDCGLHDHSDAIFGEVHLSLSAGSGMGGLWWLPSPPTTGKLEFKVPEHREEDYLRLPLKELFEHGPIWFHENGRTMRRSDSTICYPWHKWQAGHQAQNMDVWMAVEFGSLWLD
ncbi:MAG: hypothetical protein Q9167_004098 [Letrouitia subvulpina]